MNGIKYIIAICLLLSAWTAQAQNPVPAVKQVKPVILMNGTIHQANGKVIENGVLAMENGKITIVADATTIRIDMSGYEVINVQGKHIYPGLILPNTNLGLYEIGAVRATLDFNEVGEFNPNVRALIAYNTDSEIIPTLRSNGVLLAQTTPQGGWISGTSSVVQLDAWNWEDAAYKTDIGVHMNWPRMFVRSGWWAEPGETNKNERYEENVAKIKSFVEDAASYAKLEKPNPINYKLEAMKGLFDGSKKLFLAANNAKEIMDGIQMMKSLGIKEIVLVDGEESYMCIPFLKENNIPVLLSNLHRLPNRQEEGYDNPYALPSILVKGGLTVGLCYNDLKSSRNLPFYAGTAAGFGLTQEEALQTITANTAKILGIDKLTGTLEEGKDANVVVSEGDILDMKSSIVTHAFIQGRQLDLNDKHKKLNERFEEKYRRLEE